MYFTNEKDVETFLQRILYELSKKVYLEFSIPSCFYIGNKEEIMGILKEEILNRKEENPKEFRVAYKILWRFRSIFSDGAEIQLSTCSETQKIKVLDLREIEKGELKNSMFFIETLSMFSSHPTGFYVMKSLTEINFEVKGKALENNYKTYDEAFFAYENDYKFLIFLNKKAAKIYTLKKFK